MGKGIHFIKSVLCKNKDLFLEIICEYAKCLLPTKCRLVTHSRGLTDKQNNHITGHFVNSHPALSLFTDTLKFVNLSLFAHFNSSQQYKEKTSFL